MPNRNYLKGRRAEYALMARLRKAGWPYVMRTAGSHGPADVIAVRRIGPTVCVSWHQSKQGAKPSAEDRRKLAEFRAVAHGPAVSKVYMVWSGKEQPDCDCVSCRAHARGGKNPLLAGMK